MVQVIRTVDAHVGGQAVRLIVDGMPIVATLAPPAARPRSGRRADHAERFRRAIVLEPRGHDGLLAAVLSAPVSPSAHAGITFMDRDGYPAMSGAAAMAAAAMAVHRGLFFSRDAAADDVTIAFDTRAGTVYVRVHGAPAGESRHATVSLTGVPSFVHRAGHAVRIGTRELRVDIAYGGLFYAIVDTDAVGVPLDVARLPELRRLAADIRRVVNAEGHAVHPLDASIAGLAGVVFTGPPASAEAHLRNVTIRGGAVSRSPGGTGTAAVLAVLDAMGLLPDDQAFVHESLNGSVFHGRVIRRTTAGETPAVIPQIDGDAWITGEHTFFVDDGDPLADGFEF